MEFIRLAPYLPHTLGSDAYFLIASYIMKEPLGGAPVSTETMRQEMHTEVPRFLVKPVENNQLLTIS